MVFSRQGYQKRLFQHRHLKSESAYRKRTPRKCVILNAVGKEATRSVQNHFINLKQKNKHELIKWFLMFKSLNNFIKIKGFKSLFLSANHNKETISTMTELTYSGVVESLMLYGWAERNSPRCIKSSLLRNTALSLSCFVILFLKLNRFLHSIQLYIFLLHFYD